MANEQYVFLACDTLPSHNALQEKFAVVAVNFRLGPDFDLQAAEGFEPCSLEGFDTGVEVYLEKDASFLKQFTAIAPDATSCVVLRWGSSMAELCCALLISYSLASVVNGIVSYEGGPPDTPESLLDQAKQSMKHARRELERERRRKGGA